MRNSGRPRGADACRRVGTGRGPIGDSTTTELRTLLAVVGILAAGWLALWALAHVMVALGIG